MEYDPGLRRPNQHSACIVVTFIVRAACRQLMIAKLSVRQLRNATAGDPRPRKRTVPNAPRRRPPPG